MTNEKKEDLKNRILEIQKELAELSTEDLEKVAGGVAEASDAPDAPIFFVVAQVSPFVSQMPTVVTHPVIMSTASPVVVTNVNEN